MSTKLRAALLGLMLSAPAPMAQAGILAPILYHEPHSGGACTGYTGPGDITSNWVQWAGVRAFSCAIAAAATQPLFNAVRGSDTHTCDFIVASGGGVGNSANCSTGGDNGQSLTSFLTSTFGQIDTLYDQTGNGRNWTNGNSSTQPSLTISCAGTSKPCLVTGVRAQFMSATATTVSQGYSVSAVSERTGTTSYNQIWHGGTSGNSSAQLGYNDTSNQAFLGNADIVVSATDSAQHVFNGVLNGASSDFNVDGTRTTGTVTSGGTGASWTLFDFQGTGATVLTGNISEIGVNSVAFSSGTETSVCNNQRTYYGISGSC